MRILTVTGQDCTTGRSVGSFVSQTVDKLVDKRVLAGITWQGTPTKGPFNVYLYVVEAITSEEDQ